MRNFLVTIWFFAASECYAGNYWIRYFLECSSITDDSIACFNDITPQLLNAVKKEASFNTRQCALSLEDSKRILTKLNSGRDAIRAATTLMSHKDNISGYACMASRTKTIEILGELAKTKQLVLGTAARAQDGEVCEEIYSLMKLIEIRTEALMEDARKCVKKSKTALNP